MDNYLQYQNKRGIVVPDTTTLIEDTWQQYINIFGNRLSKEDSTPQARLVELESLAKKFSLGLSALTINQINPDYASGEFLDAISSLFNISRKSATRTSVSCTITISSSATPNVIIPKGTIVQDVNGNSFESESDVIIPKGTSGIVIFYCTKAGAIEVPAGSIKTPPKITGVEKIEQYSKGIIGADEESDASLLKRLSVERYTGKGLVNDVIASLNEIDGVISCKVYNNGSSEKITVGINTTVDPHSILVIIQGGNDDVIARALIENVSAGCGYTAIDGQSTSITLGFGGNNNDASLGTVIFNRPRNVDLIASVDVSIGSYNGDDLEDDVKQFITDWSANVYKDSFDNGIGDKVSVFYIANALQTTLGCVVNDLKIARYGEALSFEEIILNGSEIASFIPDNITVNITI